MSLSINLGESVIAQWWGWGLLAWLNQARVGFRAGRSEKWRHIVWYMPGYCITYVALTHARQSNCHLLVPHKLVAVLEFNTLLFHVSVPFSLWLCIECCFKYEEEELLFVLCVPNSVPVWGKKREKRVHPSRRSPSTSRQLTRPWKH